MNNKQFNSIKEFLEWKKNMELTSQLIFIQYLDVIYLNLLLRDEMNYQNPIIKTRNSQEIKARSNSLHKKNPQKNKNINKGLSLKIFLEYMNIQDFIGERIYKYLNKSKAPKLNKSDFSIGLNNIYYGDINNLIEFTFFLSDFNDDGKIYKSDMKLLLAYIPCASELTQKLKIKHINKIINTFFDSNNDISKISEEGNEKEIDFNLYSKEIQDYNGDNTIMNNSELLNDYNNNAPFFYFISIISYLFRNTPFNIKNVDYFNYYQKRMKLKLMRNSQRSSSVKFECSTTVKKNDNNINNSNNNLYFSSNELLSIKQDAKRYSIVAIPKIGQKNLFNVKRTISQKNMSCDKNDEKYNNLMNNKKKENGIIKDYIISRDKKDLKKVKKVKEINIFKNKIKKSSKNMPSFPDFTINLAKKDSTPILNNNEKTDFSLSPQLILKKNISNEDNTSNGNKDSNKNLLDMRHSISKVKLPSIPKEKLSPMSVGFKLKKEEEDKDLEEPGELVLCEYSESDEDNPKKDLNDESNNNDTIDEVFMYKYCEDVNTNLSILNKVYGVFSEKEILFFSSELKNELWDLWYIYKGHISTGKEKVNNMNYYTINITFFSNNYVNKLFFVKEDICQKFADKIKKSILDLNFNDNYELVDGQELGHGHFAKVNKCKCKESGKIYAVKIINKDELKPIDLKLIQQEKSYLSLIKHPNILSLKDYFEDKKYIYLVTECCNGGDLITYIEKNKNISEKTTAKIIRKIAEGIKYLNFFGIVHRDIKADNILFSEPNEIKTIKIIDLGVCQTLTYGEMANEPIGTPGYISPQIYLHKEYSFKTDIWSLGVILYLLITEGILPFDNENDDSKIIGKQVVYLQQDYPEEYFGNKSNGLKDLLDKMLEKTENKRIDINNLLKDSWFNILKT